MIKKLIVVALILMINSLMASPHKSGREGNNECFSCHKENIEEMFDVKFSDGSRKAIGINWDEFKKSVHGGNIECIDCHQSYTYPHPKSNYQNEDEFKWSKMQTCQRCHFKDYTNYMDGVHKKKSFDDNQSAALCIDCHGAHNIKDIKSDIVEINKRCNTCHQDITDVYEKSVHAKALTGDRNLPLCTDCHKAHDIKRTTEQSYKVTSYKICEKCHENPEIVEPYGLKPVVNSYLNDFHGMSNKLYEKGAGTFKQPIAVCTDCHGVHDIKRKSLNESLEESRKNVVKKCSKCHEGAVPNFADSWLNHYPPTLENAPLVWGVRLMYRIFIPLTLLGLLFHILLHLIQFFKKRK